MRPRKHTAVRQSIPVQMMVPAETKVPIRWDHLSLVLRALKTKGQAGDEWGNSAVALSDGRVRLSIHSIREGDTKYLIRVPDHIEIAVERMEDSL